MRTKPKILIIDDDALVRELVKAALADQGFDVTSVESTKLALTIVKKSSPDLIILDVQMPEETGVEVCRKLKADPKTAPIPVVLFSGSQEVIDRISGMDAGALEFIHKPIQTEVLAQKIREILERGKNAR